MGSRLFIERIGELEELRKGATSEDLCFVEQFSSENRRREVLAWRAIVRREVGEKCRIFHDEWGAPMVDVENVYISISHSKEWVALLISDRACAVDIEGVMRDFRKVSSRYLSEQERRMAEDNDAYAEMWCIKEALYKYHKKGELDFVRDLSILDYDADGGVATASICGGAEIKVTIKRDDNLAVAIIE